MKAQKTENPVRRYCGNSAMPLTARSACHCCIAGEWRRWEADCPTSPVRLS